MIDEHVIREALGRSFECGEAFALAMDEADPLRMFREQFCFPTDDAGAERVYFAGNSLGLAPKAARALIDQELSDWARLGVDGHFNGASPWYSYHETLRETGARLVGALPGEVVVMNSLTVNLHLMMVSFYRPEGKRHRILIEDCAFPSDTYAVKTQLAYHGYDPADALVVVKPRPGEQTLRTEGVLDTIRTQGERIALVMMSGVNYFTGQVFDMARITAAAREVGAVVGWDLAHAAGNLPLNLHDWNVDFAVWCNYKYLNAGPGAVGGCFVHARHGDNPGIRRFAGWWGNDPATRFRMHLEPEFVPADGAAGWQISNPPILAMAPVRVSYDLFDRVGMAALRAKSLILTAYLRHMIGQAPTKRFEVITPEPEAEHGCQLSIMVHDRPDELFARLTKAGVVCDVRRPNVIRVAPVPMYNSFHDVWCFSRVLTEQCGAGAT
ncbi:MAG: kynureninase [Phycisphaerae bacterium]